MEEMVQEVVEEEVQELVEAEQDTAEEEDKIEIIDVENPSYVALNETFTMMVFKFVKEDLKSIPSITPESLLNYMSTSVEGIYRQKLVGTHPNMIQCKLQIGMVNGELKGFHMFHMLPNRLPHIQSLNWAYIYSEDRRVTEKFAEEVRKYKKKWKAAFITTTVTNPKLSKVITRLFDKCVESGTYYIARNVNLTWLK